MGLKRVAHFPDLDVIRRSRLKKSTLFELPDSPELKAVQDEYLQLAEGLWNGAEPLDVKPMKDRDCSTSWDLIDGSRELPTASPADRALLRSHGADVWARLTSDEPVSGIRETVRAGREEMRNTLLSWLPEDLSGRQVLDAGCGTGVISIELAKRGAEVIAVDLSQSLIELANERYSAMDEYHRIQFIVGDMRQLEGERFDHVLAMDSIIHYAAKDGLRTLETLADSVDESMVFTFAPKTLPLAAMHAVGKFSPTQR